MPWCLRSTGSHGRCEHAQLCTAAASHATQAHPATDASVCKLRCVLHVRYRTLKSLRAQARCAHGTHQPDFDTNFTPERPAVPGRFVTDFKKSAEVQTWQDHSSYICETATDLIAACAASLPVAPRCMTHEACMSAVSTPLQRACRGDRAAMLMSDGCISSMRGG